MGAIDDIMYDTDILAPDPSRSSSFFLPSQMDFVMHTFNVPCPILPATSKLMQKLNTLSDLFLRIYRGEWGEWELADGTFWDILRDLDVNDVLTFLTKTSRAENLSDIVGAAIATHVSLHELQEKINAIIEPTTGEHLCFDDLTSVFPSDVVYFNEVFVSAEYRVGTEPFLSLTHQLTQGLLDKYDSHIPVTFFTKGHKSDESQSMLSVMNFARQIGMYQVDLEYIEKHDRFMFWLPLDILSFVFQPPFTREDFGKRIVIARNKLATRQF